MLLVEGLLGVLLPVLLKITVHAGWLMSLVNCFAGGVFFTFGEPAALEPLTHLSEASAIAQEPLETPSRRGSTEVMAEYSWAGRAAAAQGCPGSKGSQLTVSGLLVNEVTTC